MAKYIATIIFAENLFLIAHSAISTMNSSQGKWHLTIHLILMNLLW